MLLMNESDYLKQIVEKNLYRWIKETMVEMYKENYKHATPEVKEWIRSLAQPMPLYDLDEKRIEEEIGMPFLLS